LNPRGGAVAWPAEEVAMTRGREEEVEDAVSSSGRRREMRR